VNALIARRSGNGNKPTFFWIPNADLPGFTIACLYLNEAGGKPAVAVGLGCALQLPEAIYKAWLEAAGVRQLAAMALIELPLTAQKLRTIARGIYDLDTNVCWYADGRGADLVRERFASSNPLAASELPPDGPRETPAAIAHLVSAFDETGKEVYQQDLTTPDIAELGFVVERVWSPDTLSLCMPSAPPAAHGRFQAYGGLAHGHPAPLSLSGICTRWLSW